MADPKCVYIQPNPIGTLKDGRSYYTCNMHEKCTLAGKSEGSVVSCEHCRDKLFDDGDMTKFQDQLGFYDHRRQRTKVFQDFLKGRPTFLICGGPSANKLDLSQLNRRGIWSLAVNNVAGHSGFKPSAFTCSDPPQKFHDGIWKDPGVMKLIPHQKLTKGRSKLREKHGDQFQECSLRTADCPNVWGFDRRAWLRCDDSFFTEPMASWGNMKQGVNMGIVEPKTACTMLLGFRLLYYFGSRKIFLIGADFQMNEQTKYSFGQERTDDAIRENNAQFSIVNNWLCRLFPVFLRFGLQVFNCNPLSGLMAFPTKRYNEAVAETLDGFPAEPFDLSGWYEK